MNPTLLFAQFGLNAKMAQDIVLLFIVIVASIAFMLLIGRTRLVTVLISIYISIALLNVVPNKWLADYTYRIGILVGSIVVLSVLGKKMFDASISGSGKVFLFKMYLMSFLEIGLLLSIISRMMPQAIVSGYVSTNAAEYLTSEYASIFWMLMPLAFMFFIYRRS